MTPRKVTFNPGLLLLMVLLCGAATTVQIIPVHTTDYTRRWLTNENPADALAALGLANTETNIALTNLDAEATLADGTLETNKFTTNAYAAIFADLWSSHIIDLSNNIRAQLIHATNNLNGSNIVSGTVVPARMGTNVVVIAGTNAVVETNGTAGTVHSYTVNVPQWDYEGSNFTSSVEIRLVAEIPVPWVATNNLIVEVIAVGRGVADTNADSFSLFYVPLEAGRSAYEVGVDNDYAAGIVWGDGTSGGYTVPYSCTVTNNVLYLHFEDKSGDQTRWKIRARRLLGV